MNFVISIFILTLVLFSIFTYSFVDVNLSYLKGIYTGLYLNNRLLLSAIYSILIFILFGYFYYFIRNVELIKNRLNKIILVLVLITVFAYPAALTFDIFNYMTTAKVTFFYQENPYIIYPIEFLNDPYLAFTRAANKTALYGPFWVFLTGIPHFAGLGNFILTLFSFKAFIALFYVGAVYLMRKLDKTAALFFALNPLVIIESLVSSHNDIVMIFFAILAFYLFYQKRYISSLLSIIGSILIKPATMFLTPVFLGMVKDKIIGAAPASGPEGPLAWREGSARRGKKINQEKAFMYSAILMFLIFLLSPLREELYPWYAIWFIAFTAFLHKNRFLQNLVLVFSLGLMLRYIPYMATGDYFGSTPIIRNILMITPVVVFLIYSRIRILFQRSKEH